MLAKFGLQDRKGNPTSNAFLVVSAILCAVLPLTTEQLTLAIVAAVACALYQEYQRAPVQSRKLASSRENEMKRPTASTAAPRSSAAAVSRPTTSVAGSRRTSRSSGAEPTASLLPPSTGGFSPGTAARSEALDQEVDELLRVILPTPASDRMVKELARTVLQTIQPTFPEAEVTGFSTGDLTCHTSIGMAVPEVDIVVGINPHALPEQLRGRLARTGGASTDQLDARKVQKSAIRACTDHLVSAGGFKFRRSAFRGQEPKITLLAPATFAASCDSSKGKSSCDEASIPVDLSVNTVSPQCMDAVLRACRKYDARSEALIVLVRRWARDRCICHSAKGHLSPYAWSLLAVFYLQVAQHLPPLLGAKPFGKAVAGFALSEELPKSAYAAKKGAQRKTKSVACLFREFVLFYHKDFNWRSEAVSLQEGRRGAPELALPLHIVVSSAGVPSQVGPHIQDPFEPQTNLGTSMTVEGFARMQEELTRAVQFFDCDSSERSLTELFEPWVVANSAMEVEAGSELFSSSRRGSEVSTLGQESVAPRQVQKQTMTMAQKIAVLQQSLNE